jgi:hypothetical protein
MTAFKNSPKSVTVNDRTYTLLCNVTGGVYSMGFVTPKVVTYYYPSVSVKCVYRSFGYVVKYSLISITEDCISEVLVGGKSFDTIELAKIAIDKMIALMLNSIVLVGNISDSKVAQRRLTNNKVVFNQNNELDEVVTYLVSDGTKETIQALMCMPLSNDSKDLISEHWYSRGYYKN